TPALCAHRADRSALVVEYGCDRTPLCCRHTSVRRRRRPADTPTPSPSSGAEHMIRSRRWTQSVRESGSGAVEAGWRSCVRPLADQVVIDPCQTGQRRVTRVAFGHALYGVIQFKQHGTTVIFAYQALYPEKRGQTDPSGNWCDTMQA